MTRSTPTLGKATPRQATQLPRFVVALLAMGILLATVSRPALATATNFASGSYIIPMDTTYQNSGMWKAYGLLYRLLSNGIPVSWGIKAPPTVDLGFPSPSSTADTDFTVPSGVDLRTAAAVPANYAYKGGPFIIDSASVAAALPIINAWWAANVNLPVVHKATASFTANVDIVLKSPPRIANELTNAGISIGYYNTAGIPDANGAIWTTSSPGVLDETAIANGGLFLTGSACLQRKYDIFVTPHNGGYSYSLTDPTNLGTKAYSQLDTFVQQGGGWTALCHSILSNENNIKDLTINGSASVKALFKTSLPGGQPGGFLTYNGFPSIANGTGAWKVFPSAGDLPFAQSVPTTVAQALPGGSVQTWNSSIVSYYPFTERVGYFDAGAIQYDHAIAGTYHNGTGLGKLSYIGGHSYSTSVPYSTNYEAPYLRLFFNSLFFNGSAVAKLDLAYAPATAPVNTTPTINTSLINTGGSTASNINNVSITLAAGYTYVGSVFGPAPDSVTAGAGSTTIVHWNNLGDLAGGATAVTIQVSVGTSITSTVGTYKLADLAASYGDVYGEGFGANICREITVSPAPTARISKDPPTQGPFLPGDQVTWTLSYSNPGAASLFNGVVEDILPAGWAFISSVPAASSVTPLVGGTTRVRWSVGTVAVSGNGTITLVALAPEIAGNSQTFTNTVSLTGNDAGGSTFTGTDTADVDMTKPSLDLHKAVNASSALAGSTLTYTMTPTYADSVPLSNAIVADAIPANTTYVAASANAGGTTDGPPVTTVTWNLGSNAAGVPGVSSPNGTANCPAPPVTLSAAADTWIDKANATTNHGADTTMRTRPANANSLKYSLVRFDISGIPAGATIQSATLSLNVTTAQATKHFDQVRPMLTAWTEAGATWNTKNGTNGWAAGAFSTSDYSAQLATIAPKTTGVKTAIVTSAVNDWVNNGVANNGFVLVSSGTDAHDANYGTKENGTAANRPSLTIVYLQPTVGGCSGPTTVTSIGDTAVDKQNATTNTGTAATMISNAGNNNTTNNTAYSLVQFDLSAVPPGATISSATMSLDVTTNKSNQVDQVHAMSTQWAETGATWNTRDGITAWGGGSTFSSTDYKATTIASFTPSANGVQTQTVTSMVNDWVNNGVPNRGLVLVSTGTNNADAAYATRENGTAANRPSLTVNWTLPANTGPQTTVTLSASPLLQAGSGPITVTMTVHADGNVTGVTPPADLSINVDSGITAVKSSGPAPAGPLNIPANGTVTFKYVYTATPGTLPGNISFAGKPPTATDGTLFATGLSNEIIVTPPLTFQVQINSPTSATQIVNQATYSDDSAFAGGGSSNPASTTILFPQLSITKANSPTGTVSPGQPITYTMVVANDGTGTASNVVVSDTVPTNTTYASCTVGCSTNGPPVTTVTWNLGSIAPQTSQTVTFTVTANTGLAVGSYTLSNQASVSATGVSAIPSNTVTNSLQVTPQLTLAKSANPAAASAVIPGQSIVYSLLVTNTGTSAATNVQVIDAVPSNTSYVSCTAGCTTNGPPVTSVTWTIASLGAGASQTLTFTVAVNTPGLNGDIVLNQAFVTATGLSTPVASNQVSHVVSASPALTISKVRNPTTQVQPGNVITYTLSVSNVGTANTTSAVVTDALPANTQYVAGSTTMNGVAVPDVGVGAPVAAGIIVCSPGSCSPDNDGGTLVVSSPATISWQVRVAPTPLDDGTAITNTATVTSTETSPVISNTVTNAVFSTPSLTVTKATSPITSVAAGDVITYTLTVKNLGGMTATNVKIDDAVPAGTSYVPGSASNGGGLNGANVEWTGLTVVAAGLGADNTLGTADDVLTPITLTFQVLVENPWAHGTTPIPNTATATYTKYTSSDPASGSSTTASSNQTTNNVRQLTVTKTVTTPVSGLATVGDTVTYSVAVSNTGTVAITTLPLSDTFQNGCFTFQSATPAPSSQSGNILTWTNLGPLAAGTSTTVTVRLTATAACAPATNSATTSNATAADGTTVPTATSSTSITIQQIPTATPTSTATWTPTSTPTRTPTNTPRPTATPTNTSTPTVTPTATPVPGGVTGAVFEDLNGDGVQDPGEPGIANVTVTLVDPATGTVIATTTTAADGSYQFTGIVAGTYSVTETDPTGYVSTTANTVPATVPPGGTTTANFGDQRLGSVSGVTFNDANGNGIQGPGEGGLGGVTITLIDATTGAIVATTTTAADGSYTFTAVTPGSYRVQETDPNGYTSTTSNLVPISVASGGAPIVNFGDQALGTVAGSVFDDLNGNGIQDVGEPGIVGVTVKLVDSSTGAVVMTTTTTASGTYLFSGVTAGSYDIVETDPAGYVSTTLNTVPVSLPAGGAASAQFGDQRLGTVSGITFSDLNGNGTQDPGEPGIAGVTVKLINPATGAVVATTTTGATGLYTFTNVTPGSYTVQETDPAGVVSTTPNTVSVSLASGGAATANFGDQPEGTVAGTVFDDLNGNGAQDPGEAGIAGVTVRLLNPLTGATLFTTTTASDGTYLFDGIAPANYLVVETDPTGFVSTTTNTVPVTVPAGGSGSAQFGDQQVGTISGVVFNDLDGSGLRDAGEAGIGGVTMSLINPTTGAVIATTMTAGDGSYLFAGITPGNYRVQETDPNGFVSTTGNTMPVVVPAGGAATANFGDQAKGTVAGAVFIDLNGDGVRDPGEAGIGGVTVSLINPSTGAVIATTTTAGDGSYLFTDITPGSYTVRETDPSGYVSTTSNSVPITVPPGGAANAQFGDQQVGTITGAVFNDANGSGTRDTGELGLGGVTVQLINPVTGAVVASTTTGADGTYVFSNVSPGSYIVSETDLAGYVSTTSNTVPVTLTSGGSAAANFGDQQPPPDLQIAKRHSGSFRADRSGIYTLTVTNVGSGPTSGPVTVTDTLPTGLTYASASGTGWSCTGSGAAVSCTRSTAIVAGGSTMISLTVNVSAAAAAVVVNTATVSTAGDTNAANDTASDTTNVMGGGGTGQDTPGPLSTPTPTPMPSLPPDLMIAKRHSGSLRVGQAGTYTLTVTNVGNGPTTGTITVTDTLPTGLTYASASGTGLSCSGSGTEVKCMRSTAIVAGDFSAISLTVNVAASAAATVINTATVSTAGDTNAANNTASDPTNVMGGGATAQNTPTPVVTSATPPPATPTRPARVRVAKMGVRLVTVSRVPAGSVMYYTVALVLSGKGVVPDVRASLTLPPEVEFVSTDLPPTTAPPLGSFGGQLTWKLGDLISYANQPFHVEVRVRPDLPIGQRFWGELTATNGTGFSKTMRRMSYVGNGNRR